MTILLLVVFTIVSALGIGGTFAGTAAWLFNRDVWGRGEFAILGVFLALSISGIAGIILVLK